MKFCYTFQPADFAPSQQPVDVSARGDVSDAATSSPSPCLQPLHLRAAHAAAVGGVVPAHRQSNHGWQQNRKVAARSVK